MFDDYPDSVEVAEVALSQEDNQKFDAFRLLFENAAEWKNGREGRYFVRWGRANVMWVHLFKLIVVFILLILT